MKKGMLLAFGEMYLKSKGVKNIFQKKLENNLRFFLKDSNILSFRDRIFVFSSGSAKIKKIFGISWYSECFYFPEKNFKELSGFIKENYKSWIKEKDTYALDIRIQEGAVSESKEIIINKIADLIDRKVNLSKPKKKIFIEIRKQGYFLYFKKTKALGGLPASSGGRALVLMSGGIDSPVCAYLCLKRGLENVWVHFHSFPLVSNSSILKIERLAEMFLKYQKSLKVYFVPFSKAQIEIKAKSAPQYRVILYRRLMLKIAEGIAEKERISGVVTGESLGQVSSQTLENINVIEEAVKIPVLRPLISMDKEEIIKIAKKIKTFDISIMPQEDCCTLFVSKRQTAKGDIKTTKELEKKINTEGLIEECINKAEVKIFPV